MASFKVVTGVRVATREPEEHLLMITHPKDAVEGNPICSGLWSRSLDTWGHHFLGFNTTSHPVLIGPVCTMITAEASMLYT